MRRLIAATLVILANSPYAQSQGIAAELTAAGKAVLEAKLVTDGDRSDPEKPLIFPFPMCTFPDGLCGAVRRNGTVAVPPRYDWVGNFSGGRAPVRSGGLYGFVDENGREVVPPRYRIVGDYRFGFAQVDIDGKSGAIDLDGKLAIEPRYGAVEAIAADRFRVSDKRQLRGTSGSEDFPSGTVVVLRRDEGTISDSSEEPKFEIIDRTGRLIEPPGGRANQSRLAKPQFNAVDPLIDGLARVRVAGRFGFIDGSGRVVIDPVFDEAWAFAPGSTGTPVRQGKRAGVIDRTGAWVFMIEADELRRAISFGKSGEAQFGWHFRRYRVPVGGSLLANRWGLLDLDGHILLEAEFDQPPQRCADGHLAASKDKEWLYFRNDGSPLQPPKGRIVGASCSSLAPYTVNAGGKFGLVDGDGKQIAPPEFDALVSVTKDIWNAKRDGKWGRIGLDGHWLFEPKFDDLSRNHPVIVAAVNGKRGFLKADGSWLIEPRFDAARLLDSETALVAIDDTAGAIRLQDQSWVVRPRPGMMCEIPYGLLWQRDGHRAIFSRKGEAWIDADVDRLGLDLESGMLPFLKGGKWGLLDTAGKVAIDAVYDAQVSFRPQFRGIAWAVRDGRSCPIDRHGRAVPGIACIERARLSEAGGYFKCGVEP